MRAADVLKEDWTNLKPRGVRASREVLRATAEVTSCKDDAACNTAVLRSRTMRVCPDIFLFVCHLISAQICSPTVEVIFRRRWADHVNLVMFLDLALCISSISYVPFAYDEVGLACDAG